MKRISLLLALCALSFTALTGCVAVPPLVNVQHDHHTDPNTEERLKSIERRLDRLEEEHKVRAIPLEP